jgi:hypothetical protein
MLKPICTRDTSSVSFPIQTSGNASSPLGLLFLYSLLFSLCHFLCFLFLLFLKITKPRRRRSGGGEMERKLPRSAIGTGRPGGRGGPRRPPGLPRTAAGGPSRPRSQQQQQQAAAAAAPAPKRTGFGGTPTPPPPAGTPPRIGRKFLIPVQINLISDDYLRDRFRNWRHF